MNAHKKTNTYTTHTYTCINFSFCLIFNAHEFNWMQNMLECDRVIPWWKAYNDNNTIKEHTNTHIHTQLKKTNEKNVVFIRFERYPCHFYIRINFIASDRLFTSFNCIFLQIIQYNYLRRHEFKTNVRLKKK